MPGNDRVTASSTEQSCTEQFEQRGRRAPRRPASNAAAGRRRAAALGLCALLACGLLAMASAASAGALAAPRSNAAGSEADAGERPFVNGLSSVRTVGSTVPRDGDLNPYGIVDVNQTTGSLVAGDVLVSNFNDAENEQGTGTTIVQLTPGGHESLFAQLSASTLPGECPGGIGLTTALALLPQGYVVVGSLPTRDGEAETAEAGCLIVLNSDGQPVETIAGAAIDGPWDMTSVAQGEQATLFVTNVLNGTVASGETPVDEGTVVRLKLRLRPKQPPKVSGETVIGEGFPERTDPEALVIGPTGVALGGEGTLYVADTLDDRLAAIPRALTRHAPLGQAGTTVASGGFLSSPLGMALAPNGDILTANGGNGEIVETTPGGAQARPFETGAGAGGLFGLALTPSLKGLYFVNDAENTLDLAR